MSWLTFKAAVGQTVNLKDLLQNSNYKNCHCSPTKNADKVQVLVCNRSELHIKNEQKLPI